MNLVSENYVPHSGEMCLLGELVNFTDTSLTAECIIQSDNIYLSTDRLHNTVLIEYMAQTIAAHAKMSEAPGKQTAEAKIGFLLGVKFFRSSIEWLRVGDQFSVTINQDIRMATGLAVFDSYINSDSFDATARLNVFQPPDVEQFLQDIKTS